MSSAAGNTSDVDVSAAVDAAVEEVVNNEVSAEENGTDSNAKEGTDNGDSKVRRDPKTAAEAVRAMSSLAASDVSGNGVSGKGVLKTSIETFRMSDGKKHKNDLYVDSEEKALDLIQKMVSAAATSKKGTKWEFRSVPIDQFGKTLDDVYLAFLRWAAIDDADATEHGEGIEKKKSEEGKQSRINVSKAYRRLESYASWMEDAKEDLAGPGPLTAQSVRNAWDAWKMRVSYDSSSRLVWWFDLGALDLGKCKKIPPEESLRLFVWLSHAIMFDDNAQRNGMVFAEDCAKIGFWDVMTLFPMKLGLKLDRLTIGVLPVKMKKLYILNTPVWCDLLMKMMGAFMSKKMKKRIVTVKDKDHAKAVDELGGAEYTLANFGGCNGTMISCVIEDTYFSKEGAED